MRDEMTPKENLVSWIVVIVVAGAIGAMLLFSGGEDDDASESENAPVEGTAVFPSHGMVDEKISAAEEAGEAPATFGATGERIEPEGARLQDREAPAKESFELVPLETGETANVVGQRVYVGPLRNLGKDAAGKDLVCHDVSFLNGMDHETWLSASNFSLITPTGQKMEYAQPSAFPRWDGSVLPGQTTSGVQCYQAPIAEGTYTVNYTPFNAKFPLAAWKSGLSSPE